MRDIIKAQAEFITDELKNGIPVRLPKLGEFHVQKSTRFGGYDFVKKEKKGMITVISPKFKLSEGFKNAIHEVLPE